MENVYCVSSMYVHNGPLMEELDACTISIESRSFKLVRILYADPLRKTLSLFPRGSNEIKKLKMHFQPESDHYLIRVKVYSHLFQYRLINMLFFTFEIRRVFFSVFHRFSSSFVCVHTNIHTQSLCVIYKYIYS